MLASVAVEEALLVLKIAFLVLLYLFIWRIVRTASRDVRVPQESFVLPPHGGGVAGPPHAGRLIVVRSPSLATGADFAVDSEPVTMGRAAANDIALDGDEFASARHARLERRGDGVWLEDEGSTNGTFVNGVRLSRPRRLEPGDVVRVGATDLRFEG